MRLLNTTRGWSELAAGLCCAQIQAPATLAELRQLAQGCCHIPSLILDSENGHSTLSVKRSIKVESFLAITCWEHRLGIEDKPDCGSLSMICSRGELVSKTSWKTPSGCWNPMEDAGAALCHSLLQRPLLPLYSLILVHYYLDIAGGRV
mgnify:CR=1 FL=1